MVHSTNLVVCLTGAAGQIAYALLPSLCDGSIFGSHQVTTFITFIISLLPFLEN
jgi:hypothetical protein